MSARSSNLRFFHLVGTYAFAHDRAGFLVLRGNGNTTISDSLAAVELVAEMLFSGARRGILCDLVGIDELPYPTTVVRLVDKIEELGVFTAGVALLLRPADQTRLGHFAVDHAEQRGLQIRTFTRYDGARDWLVQRVAEKQA